MCFTIGRVSLRVFASYALAHLPGCSDILVPPRHTEQHLRGFFVRRVFLFFAAVLRSWRVRKNWREGKKGKAKGGFSFFLSFSLPFGRGRGAETEDEAGKERGGQNLGNVGGFFIWCASDSGTLGIASVPMSLRGNPSKGIEEGRLRGWWGELFSFYKLVQFFLKKRVNTAETGCVYADSGPD